MRALAHSSNISDLDTGRKYWFIQRWDPTEGRWRTGETIYDSAQDALKVLSMLKKEGHISPGQKFRVIFKHIVWAYKFGKSLKIDDID